MLNFREGAYQTGDLAVRDDGRDNGELGEAELGSGDGLSLAIHRALEDGMGEMFTSILFSSKQKHVHLLIALAKLFFSIFCKFKF